MPTIPTKYPTRAPPGYSTQDPARASAPGRSSQTKTKSQTVKEKKPEWLDEVSERRSDTQRSNFQAQRPGESQSKRSGDTGLGRSVKAPTVHYPSSNIGSKQSRQRTRNDDPEDDDYHASEPRIRYESRSKAQGRYEVGDDDQDYDEETPEGMPKAMVRRERTSVQAMTKGDSPRLETAFVRPDKTLANKTNANKMNANSETTTRPDKARTGRTNNDSQAIVRQDKTLANATNYKIVTDRYDVMPAASFGKDFLLHLCKLFDAPLSDVKHWFEEGRVRLDKSEQPAELDLSKVFTMFPAHVAERVKSQLAKEKLAIGREDKERDLGMGALDLHDRDRDRGSRNGERGLGGRDELPRLVPVVPVAPVYPVCIDDCPLRLRRLRRLRSYDMFDDDDLHYPRY